jgi:hypothetical protein
LMGKIPKADIAIPLKRLLPRVSRVSGKS